MIQLQIVEYAKAQLSLGISEEVIKSALIDVGWVQADVDDSIRSVTLKKVSDTIEHLFRSSTHKPAFSGISFHKVV